MDKKLILLMKNYPCLYDHLRDDYKEPTKRETTWVKVANELAIEVEDAKRRWKNLRDRYGKERRHNLSDEYNSKWVHYEAMSYFSEFIIPRKHFRVGSVGHTSTMVLPEENMCFTVTEDGSYAVEENLDVQDSVLCLQNEDHATTSGTSGYNTPEFPGMKNISGHSKMTKPVNREDEDFHFGMTVAGLLRQLPNSKLKQLARLKIMQVLYEVEYGAANT